MLKSTKLLPETLGCAPPPPRASSGHAFCARDHGAPEAGHEPAPSCPGRVCRVPDKQWAWGCFVTSAPAAPQREGWVRRAPWELRRWRLPRLRPLGLPRPRPSPGSPRPRPSPGSLGGPTPGLQRPRPTPPPVSQGPAPPGAAAGARAGLASRSLQSRAEKDGWVSGWTPPALVSSTG